MVVITHGAAVCVATQSAGAWVWFAPQRQQSNVGQIEADITENIATNPILLETSVVGTLNKSPDKCKAGKYNSDSLRYLPETGLLI